MIATSHPERACGVVPTYGDVVAPPGAGRAATGPLFAWCALNASRSAPGVLPDLVLPRPSAA